MDGRNGHEIDRERLHQLEQLGLQHDWHLREIESQIQLVRQKLAYIEARIVGDRVVGCRSRREDSLEEDVDVETKRLRMDVGTPTETDTKTRRKKTTDVALYVSGFPLQFSNKHLRRMFETYHTVIHARVLKSTSSTGVGIVVMRVRRSFARS